MIITFLDILVGLITLLAVIAVPVVLLWPVKKVSSHS
jgi:hypothetical protein